MEDFYRPLDLKDIPTQDWLCGPIDAEFVGRFLRGQLSKEECRHIGFREQTSRPELIERTVLEIAGTVLTAQLALHYGLAANVAGGTHHAHMSGGAGYTILNDLAVTAHVLTTTSSDVARVLVVDCDVHQGDGTAKFGASVLQGSLFTLSLHCASNYPQLKAHSTYDVGLPDGMEDEAYLEVLRASVSKAIREVEPDLVLYDAGVDIYKGDRLGRLHVSEDGIRKRDRWVLEYCVTQGIPVAAVVGGGYDKDVHALARRHAIVHEEASYVWRKHKLWEKAPTPATA
jgi:acetoin utilization deacetylase AcuC-like enzyme